MTASPARSPRRPPDPSLARSFRDVLVAGFRSIVGRRSRPRRGARPPTAPGEILRAFEMGKSSRLTASWPTTSGSINTEIYHALHPMRSRSRDLWANNEYAKRWIELVKENVVGPHGMHLKMDVRDDAGRRDTTANRIIEREWREFTRRRNFSADGRIDGVDGQNLAIETAARDGEVGIRTITGDLAGPYGFAVKFTDVDRIDTWKNESAPDRVVMGVGMNAMGRPEEYHILRTHPNALVREPRGDAEVVSAEEFVHAFIQWRAEQARGVPWAHAASVALWDLGGYREAGVIAARMGASKLGWWSTPTGDDAPYDGVDEAGQRYVSAEPGEFGQVEAGSELIQWDPDYPHAQFGAFNAAMLRGISAGLGPAYHSLSGDLSGTSFTSGRLGRLSEQDHYLALQRWTGTHVLDEIFARWLRYALITGKLGPLRFASFERFNRPNWVGRRWQHVQPREEATAAAINFGMRTTSLSRLMIERGIDPEVEFERIAEDIERLRSLGIEPTLPGNLQAESEVSDPGETA